MACKIASWVAALRLPYFITSLIPPALALCLLWKEQGRLQAETLSAFWLLLPGCLCMHAATNLFNDYYDTINGVDNPNSIGGSRVVLNGLLTLRDLRLGGIFSYILSFMFFMALSVHTGRLWIMSGWALGFLLSFFYVGPPLAYGYRGWGEAGSFMGMGWLLLFGSYLALGGGFSLKAVCLASLLGAMTAEVLFFQSLPQLETDPAYKKYTLAARLGRRRCFQIQSLFWPLIWLACGLLVLTGQVGWGALFCLCGLPLYLKSQLRLRQWVRGLPSQELYDSGSLIRGIFFITSAALFIAVLWN